MTPTGSFRPIAIAVFCLSAMFFQAARSWGGELDVVCIYPPPNSQFYGSAVTVFGYVVGQPVKSVKARVVNISDESLPQTQELNLFKGKIFSGQVEFQPGQSNLVIGESVIPIFFEPDAEAGVHEGFNIPLPHSGKIDSCNPCHGFSQGGLTLKSKVSDLCLSCHKIGTKSLRSATRKNEHTNSVTPNCVKCHDPHVSFNRNLLRSFKDTCTSCHEKYGKAPLHDSVGTVECVSCHDPHSSANEKMLKEDAENLCAQCHGKVIKPGKYPVSFHAPVRDGKCFDCHSAHPGEFSPMLLTWGDELCARCHADTSSKMFKGGKACLDCHNAHLSASSKRLLKADAWSICVECHEASLGVPGSHRATKRKCGNCHDPHSPGGFASLENACRQCHNFNDENFKWAHGQTPMTSAAQCAKCHKLHDSEFPKLLAGDVHYPVQRGGCNSCHTMDGKELGLRYVGSQNCMRCHGDVTGSSVVVDTKRVHMPVYQRDCTACHNPHVGKKKLLNEEPEKLCGECHGLFLRGIKNVHGVFKEGGSCPTCHMPHISDFEPLLKKPQVELCTECHKTILPKDKEKYRLLHGAVKKGLCTGCHNPHGTNTEKLLKNEKDKLCRDCHASATVNEEGQQMEYLHGPVGAGNCTACHKLGHGHERDGDQFLAADRMDVCTLCHEILPEHVPANYASKMREVGNECLACHNPHGANNPKMLRPEVY